MKILRLKLQNINSLIGEVEIDFQKEFAQTLFLITGATGSGKTTILDAICCALYARTPRLARATEELLSRNQTQAMIVLDYEIEGEVYRNNWSVKRANNKVDGKIQAKKHSLSQKKGTTFEIICSKSTEVVERVQSLTGLDFSQFQKSMLLSQGNFDAFLKADAKERANLLEKMTGTQIYAKIGQKAYEVYQSKLVKLNELKIAYETISFLQEDVLQEYNKELQLRHKELQKITQQTELLSQKLSTLQKVQSIEQMLIGYKQKIDSLKLEEQTTLQRYEQLQKEYATTQKEFEQFELYYKEESLKLQKVKALEHEVRLLEKQKQKLFHTHNTLLEELALLKHSVANLTEQKEQLVQENKVALEYLKDHAQDSSLVEDFSKLHHLLNEYKKQHIVVHKLAQTEKNLIQQLQTVQQSLQDDRVSLKEQQEQQRYYEAKLFVSSFEKAREQLKEGEACPLCGATHHPYLEEKLESESSLSLELKNITMVVEELTQRVETSSLSLVKIESELASTRKNFAELEQQLSELQKDLSFYATNYNFSLDEDLSQTIQVLQQRYEHYVNAAQQSEHFEKLYAGYESKLSVLDAKIGSLSQQIEQLQSEQVRLESSIEDLSKERYDLFGDLVTQQQELLLESQKKSKEQQRAHIEKHYRECEKNLVVIQNSLEEFTTLSLQKESELELLQKHLEKEVLSELEKELTALHQQRDSINKRAGELEQLLREDAKQRERSKGLQERLVEHKVALEPYDILSSLIGSAKGDKFKAFAQNLTFGYLLSLANSHLATLNARYYLIQKEGEELALLVEDRFMANEQRDVKTLSGGESFLVSLALALGLSDMVSSKISIDSLFLDEGFGTLDPESLNDALVTLNRLQNSGKMIGIISHVEILKEEIVHQIQITKGAHGMSKVRVI